jgi:hypothetical protein
MHLVWAGLWGLVHWPHALSWRKQMCEHQGSWLRCQCSLDLKSKINFPMDQEDEQKRIWMLQFYTIEF